MLASHHPSIVLECLAPLGKHVREEIQIDFFLIHKVFFSEAKTNFMFLSQSIKLGPMSLCWSSMIASGLEDLILSIFSKR